jgi:regulator of replication initiation timing
MNLENNDDIKNVVYKKDETTLDLLTLILYREGYHMENYHIEEYYNEGFHIKIYDMVG